jgi:hypothetical protein
MGQSVTVEMCNLARKCGAAKIAALKRTDKPTAASNLQSFAAAAKRLAEFAFPSLANAGTIQALQNSADQFDYIAKILGTVCTTKVKLRPRHFSVYINPQLNTVLSLVKQDRSICLQQKTHAKNIHSKMRGGLG